jgi:DNA primase
MDVKDLLVDKDISFIPKGADYLISCLNPDHEDRNPSLRVDSVTGVFQCFSCGFKGNLFTFYEETPNYLQIQRNSLRSKIKTTMASSVGLNMPQGTVPYLGTWRNIKSDTYEKFGAFQHHDSDFIGRIVFPITDISGRIMGFQGRHTGTTTPKYKAVPVGAKLPIFPTVKPRKGHIILVEGLFDVLNLHDKGLTNSCCVFGTQTVTETKLSLLYLQGAQTIDIFMDGDDAGQKAAEKIKHMCENINLLTRNICIGDTDPGALSQEQVTKLSRKLYG